MRKIGKDMRNVGHDGKGPQADHRAPADGMEGTREKQNRNSE